MCSGTGSFVFPGINFFNVILTCPYLTIFISIEKNTYTPDWSFLVFSQDCSCTFSFPTSFTSFYSLSFWVIIGCNGWFTWGSFCRCILILFYRILWIRRLSGWRLIIVVLGRVTDMPIFEFICTISKMWANEHPKYAPSTSWHFFFGM